MLFRSYKNTNEVNSPELMLSEFDNIEIVNDPKTIQIAGYSISMMPWICAENYSDSMERLKDSDAAICCGHFEIAGFAMYRRMPSEEGLDR